MASTPRSNTSGKKRRSAAGAGGADSGRFQRDPNSVPSQLEALAVGESFARGARIPVDEFMAEEIDDWFTRTTRVLSMQVARTKENNPKRDFSIERVSGMAHGSANMLCALIVTRTA